MEIEVRHLAPTPLGAQVTCSTRVIGSEENTVTFTLEARDEHEVILRGLHKRGIIRVASFSRRLARKGSPPAT
jgi:fluoroacetyl-CoA thioesterase